MALTDLPVEILDEVCILLCRHCRPYAIKISKPSIQEAPTWNPIDTDNLERKALLNLCLTSKSLRNVAQPILFHNFFHHRNLNWQNTETNLIPRLCKLLRTIDESPRLALGLKSLDIKAYEEKCTCCPQYVPRATFEEEDIVVKFAKKTGLVIDTSDLDGDSLPEALIQLLLVSAPNLLQLNLCVPRWWTFKPLATWSHEQEKETENSRAFLHHVQQMELDIEKDQEDTCYEEHDDNWCDSCGHPTTPSPVERLLVHAAPNVKILSCTAGALDNLPSLPQLRCLQIQLKGSWDGMLPKLMERLPRLTHFSYISNNHCSPTPRDIQDSLVGHHNILEYLNVVQQRWMATDWKPRTGKRYAMTSLAEFTALKTINVDGYMIWPNRDGGATVEEVESDLLLLPRFLPESLEQLHVDGWDSHDDESFRSLFKAMEKKKFQCLKMVFWGIGAHCYDPDTTMKPWAVGEGWRAVVPSEVGVRMGVAHDAAFPD